MVAVDVAYGPLAGGNCFFEPSRWFLGGLLLVPGGFRIFFVGHNGHVHAQSSNNDTQKNGS